MNQDETPSAKEKRDCCDETALAPSAALDDLVWGEAVRRLMRDTPPEIKRREFYRLLTVVTGGLELAVKKHPHRLGPAPSPENLTLDDLLNLLAESITGKPGTRTKSGMLKQAVRLDSEEGYRREEPPASPGTRGGEEISRAGGSSILCDLLLGNCVDLGCDFNHNGSCWLVPGILQPVVEDDCVCLLPPDWKDLALVALLAALVLTPIPGDEVLASGAVLARLLRLIVRVRPLVPVPA